MPKILDHLLHLSNIRVDSNRNLKLLYLNRVFRDLVNKLSFFFFPIYLFELGKNSVLADLPLTDIQKGMLMVVIFYLVMKIINLITFIPTNRFFVKFGYQRTMTASYLMRIISLVVIYYTGQYPDLIWLVIFLEAIHSGLFWPTYYTLLSRYAIKSKMGADLGVLQLMLQIVAMLSPAVAGFISVQLGLSVLFLFGIAGTMVSLILSMMTESTIEKDQISWREFLSWMREPRYSRLAMALGGRYINDSIIYIWPLYVFFILGSVDKVGYLYSIALFMAFLVTFFLASMIDKIRSHKLFKTSGGIMSVLWLFRTQIISPWSIAFIDATNTLVGNFHWLFFEMQMMRRGKGSQAFSYFVYSEIIAAIAGTLMWSVVGVIFLIGKGWTSVFLVGSLAVLLSTLMTERHAFDGPHQ
ncbi:MAG: MFS transporter [Patescibacteria group bacterium]|nr:hypothetical protein [Patescibacteria group bacterium]